MSVSELDAEARGDLGQSLGEFVAIARLVIRQPEPARDLVAHRSQGRLGPDASGRIEDLERHAALGENLDVLGGAVDLLRRAEELQRALHALVIGDSGLRPERDQAVPAVFREAHHPPLVQGIAFGRAIAQQAHEPGHHGQIEIGPEDQRRMPHEEPFERLDGMPGAAQGDA